MGTLSFLFPLSLCCPLTPSHSSSRTHRQNRTSWPHISSNTLKFAGIRGRTVVFGGNSSEPNETQFLDENGVVDDMDGYLNYLSLEYDSVWDTKPSWWACLFFVTMYINILKNVLVKLWTLGRVSFFRRLLYFVARNCSLRLGRLCCGKFVEFPKGQMKFLVH